MILTTIPMAVTMTTTIMMAANVMELTMKSTNLNKEEPTCTAQSSLS